MSTEKPWLDDLSSPASINAQYVLRCQHSVPKPPPGFHTKSSHDIPSWCSLLRTDKIHMYPFLLYVKALINPFVDTLHSWSNQIQFLTKILLPYTTTLDTELQCRYLGDTHISQCHPSIWREASGPWMTKQSWGTYVQLSLAPPELPDQSPGTDWAPPGQACPGSFCFFFNLS